MCRVKQLFVVFKFSESCEPLFDDLGFLFYYSQTREELLKWFEKVLKGFEKVWEPGRVLCLDLKVFERFPSWKS